MPIEATGRSIEDDQSKIRKAEEKRAILLRALEPEASKLKAPKKREQITEEESRPRAIDKETEREVVIQKERCIVCDSPLSGTTYICPVCDTKYCIRCQEELVKRNEPCWRCNTPLTDNNAKVCQNCGAKLPKDAIYCGECGHGV